MTLLPSLLDGGRGHSHCRSGAHQLAGASGLGPIILPANGGTMELLWYCGRAKTAAPPPPFHGEGYPDALAQGVSTQTDRRGKLPSWARPTQCAACLCVQMSAWGGLMWLDY